MLLAGTCRIDMAVTGLIQHWKEFFGSVDFLQSNVNMDLHVNGWIGKDIPVDNKYGPDVRESRDTSCARVQLLLDNCSLERAHGLRLHCQFRLT